jgi:hypothetical protein
MMVRMAPNSARHPVSTTMTARPRPALAACFGDNFSAPAEGGTAQTVVSPRREHATTISAKPAHPALAATTDGGRRQCRTDGATHPSPASSPARACVEKNAHGGSVRI